ncbi:UDP-N-acetylmuramoyl-tripeptide--D-alanyl-D-alanine ligase [Owenweeksia hongkongensis]|uniref:UDP-N-acetylmuramoyl-tripeptide--D-alanyl-D- alanine ligase n=1 Tax=Owenweeksia hongkongensis TaxID=253245 RepID=UPI003A8ED6BC
MTIPELHKAYLLSKSVSTDTRAIEHGDIYFALKGDNFDGNKFAQQAIDSGANLAVIDDPKYQTEKTVLVEDVLSTLQQLSSYHRDQLTIPVIGLTGSNGKTTTKELIAAALRPKFKVAFTKGNLNNHIGVPLTILSIKPEHEIAVVEMGANHQKEIEFLCSLCRPDFGYITNFGKAHLEGFGGIEGVIKGKTELYNFLRENRKTVFVNNADPIQVEKSTGMEVICFGQNPPADVQIKLQESKGSELDVTYKGVSIHSNLTGTYNFPNISAAIAIADHFGVTPDQIKAGLENYFPTNNRSQVTKTENNTLIVDTYNANPSSMEAALKNMATYSGEHKWVLLGDMFELGEFEKEEHQRIANLALAQNFEKVILVGKAFAACTTTDSIQFEATSDLLVWLESNPVKGKTILLKGSRGMAIERALPLL